MEIPKTLETLEGQNPVGVIGLISCSENCTGFQSVGVEESGEVIGVRNVEIETLFVEVEKRVGGIVGENLYISVDTMDGVEENGKSIDRFEKGGLMNDVVGGKNEDRRIEGSSGKGSEDVEVEKIVMGGVMKEEKVPESIAISIDGFEKGDLVNYAVDRKTEDLEDISESRIDRRFGSSSSERSEDVEDEKTGIEVSGHSITFNMEKEGELESLLTSGEENLKEAEYVEREEVINNQGCKFFVGDIIWVKTKSMTWWPGKIYDSSDESEYAAASDKKDSHLVRYFGSGHVTWCCPSHLKPFHENFELMLEQNKSRSFVAAVEKAVNEFGKCVKLEMTSFIQGKSQQLAGDAETQKAGLEGAPPQLGEFSITHFYPADFLGNIKILAQVVSAPSMLELTVLQNRISAFYCSLGHSQLPMHQLRGTTDDDKSTGDKGANENRGSGKRTRGDWDISLDNRGSDAGDEVIVSDNLASKLKKEKDSEVSNVSDEVEDINDNGETSLLRSPTTTRSKSSRRNSGDDGSTGKFDKGFEARARKKSKYLSYPYINLEQKDSSAEIEDSKILKVSHVEVGKTSVGESDVSSSLFKYSGKKFGKKLSRKSNTESDLLKVINTSSAELLSELALTAMDCLYPIENENFDLVELFFCKFRTSVYNVEMFNEYVLGQTDVTEPYLVGTDLSNVVSDVNGQLDTPQKTRSSHEFKPKQKMSKEKQKNGPARSNTKPPSDPSNVNMSNSTSITESEKMVPLIIPNNKPERKKRKKKEGTVPSCLQTNQTTGIPDLNGNTVIPSLFEENSPIFGQVASEVKSEPKKSKRKEGTAPKGSKAKLAVGIPDLNGIFDSAKTNKETQGTSLLLTFSPGVTLPSKEVLMSTFGLFGPVKESDISFLKESGTAQVVFTRSAEAGEAFKSIEKNNPFGATISFGFHNLSAASNKVPEPNNNLSKTPVSLPMERLEAPAMNPSVSSIEPPPPIDFIKQNLQMMTSMLEKAGDNLSPEMRTKLEGEIKGLLQKVSTMPGSSSTP